MSSETSSVTGSVTGSGTGSGTGMCGRCYALFENGRKCSHYECGKEMGWEPDNSDEKCLLEGFRGEAATGDEGENPKDRIGLQKLPLRLIPPPALAYLAMVMKQGADKYGPYNWREKKVRASVYVEAAIRHLEAYLDGEDCDPDPPHMPHPAHAMACCAILLDALATGNLVDDRPPPGRFAQLAAELTQKKET